MIQSWSRWRWQLVLATSVTISGASVTSRSYVLAQKVTPDSTLGIESSQARTTSPGVVQIDGGATRGKNLFHSFSEFSVPTHGTAYFHNASSIQNIISRVTGDSISTIDGSITAHSTVNLFLINPRGIIFGPHVSLKIGGSFLASTASSLKFDHGYQFSATAPQAVPLLTVSVPIGIQFGRSAGEIRVQGSGLAVEPGQTLALVGGDVTVEGGDLAASEGTNLAAPAGRIELGSVAESGLVSLTLVEKGWELGYEGIPNFKDIKLSHQAFIDASNDVKLSSQVEVNALGKEGGDVQLQGRHITLTDGSGIATGTSGAKPGGTLSVNATDSVELSGTSENSNFFSSLSSQTRGDGAAGKITINTGKLIVQDGSQIDASSIGKGKGGDLSVIASDEVELTGTRQDGQPSALFARTGTENQPTSADAGNLTINTRKLSVQNGALVSASAVDNSKGNGGTLSVNASDSIELAGTAPTPSGQIFSGLFAQATGGGNAGGLALNTGKLMIRNEAIVNVSAKKSGLAGNLQVTARSIQLDNQASFTSTTESGHGGDINLNVQDLLLMRRGSRISTTAGQTNMGGDGGNITINTPFIVALPQENSDIMANAYTGKGGFIRIPAQGIFGIEPGEQLTPLSDITAFSQKNPALNGVLQINTLGINPSQGLVNLPVQPLNVTGLIAQGCPAEVGPRASIFVVTGRGGLPPNPREALRSEPALVDLGTTVQGQQNHASATDPSNPTNSEPAPLVEATGWVTNALGEVVLVATVPTVAPDIPWLRTTSCHLQ